MRGMDGRSSARLSPAVAVGLVLICLLGSAIPAIATTNVAVPRGTHNFGHLTPDEAIVARVAADGVGFEGAEGATGRGRSTLQPTAPSGFSTSSTTGS